MNATNTIPIAEDEYYYVYIDTEIVQYILVNKTTNVKEYVNKSLPTILREQKKKSRQLAKLGFPSLAMELDVEEEPLPGEFPLENEDQWIN